MQAGGIPALSTDMMLLFVQAYARKASRDRFSRASLFMDIRQAFYRVFRPFLIRHCHTDANLIKFFQDNGWDSAIYHQFQQAVQAPAALCQAKVSPHQQAQVSAMLATTWFECKGANDTLTLTTTGTRPGDSAADLLFGYVMARYVHSLRSKFLEAGLAMELNLQWVPPCTVEPGDMPPTQLIQAVWVNDLVILLRAQHAHEMQSVVCRALQIVQMTASEYGLHLNFGRDKTSLLIILRGPNARTEWNTLLAADPTCPRISVTVPGSPHPLGLK